MLKYEIVDVFCVKIPLSLKSVSFWGLRPLEPLPGIRPWTALGDFCPQTPSLSLNYAMIQIL